MADMRLLKFKISMTFRNIIHMRFENKFNLEKYNSVFPTMIG